MSANSSAFAQFSKFLSIAVASCIAMTGGMYAYNNRTEIVESFHKDGQPGNWFTRWAGVDTTRLRDDGNLFPEQKAFVAPNLEMDADWYKKINQPVEFDWNR